MRVVHVITTLDPGGAEHALLRLARGCAARGVEQRVFVLRPGGTLMAEAAAAGLQPQALDLRRRPLGAALQLARALRAWRPDVMQTWMYHADVFGGLVARAVGCPVVWGVRQTSIGEVATSASVACMYRAARALSAHVPAAVVFNAQAACSSHRRFGYRHAQSHIVHNGLDLQALQAARDEPAALRQELGLPADTLLLGHLGRYTPEKDHGTLLQAFALSSAAATAAAQTPLHLVAAGRGVDAGNATLVALIDRLQLQGRVHLLGERSDPARVLAGLDFFVLSSRHEGFPNALLEAMALGLPCITTDCGDAAHLAGDAAHVVPPGDPPALAAALSAMAALAPAQRQRIGAAGALRVAQHFGLNAMCDGFETVWRQVARRADVRRDVRPDVRPDFHPEPHPDPQTEGTPHVRHRRTPAS